MYATSYSIARRQVLQRRMDSAYILSNRITDRVSTLKGADVYIYTTSMYVYYLHYW